jgi:hypothetical protein
VPAANKEMIMRVLLIAIAALFVAGFATTPTPTGEKIAVYDHRNNVTRYACRPTDSKFVGTSAKTENVQKTKRAWYAFGHP